MIGEHDIVRARHAHHIVAPSRREEHQHHDHEGHDVAVAGRDELHRQVFDDADDESAEDGARNEARVSERGIGVIFLVNTLVIVFAQLPIARLLEGRRRMPALALSSRST